MIEDGIRVDSGVKANWKVSPAYDPMVAKVIAHGESGDESPLTLIEALSGMSIEGLTNNIGMHRAILDSESLPG